MQAHGLLCSGGIAFFDGGKYRIVLAVTVVQHTVIPVAALDAGPADLLQGLDAGVQDGIAGDLCDLLMEGHIIAADVRGIVQLNADFQIFHNGTQAF